MNKKFIMVNTLLLLLFLLVSSDLISQEKVQKNDFRNTRWGMKIDKVLSTEKNKPIDSGPYKQYILVVHAGEVAGFEARIFQHEYDHINGVIFLDRIEKSEDIFTEKEYLRLISETP